jgi:hypothetical protein
MFVREATIVIAALLLAACRPDAEPESVMSAEELRFGQHIATAARVHLTDGGTAEFARGFVVGMEQLRRMEGRAVRRDAAHAQSTPIDSLPRAEVVSVEVYAPALADYAGVLASYAVLAVLLIALAWLAFRGTLFLARRAGDALERGRAAGGAGSVD